MEVNILYAIGYELQRIRDSPHKFLLMFLKTLKAEKQFVQRAFNYANDCYLGVLPIHYPPELLATACIYLAYKSTTVAMPRLAWWVLAEYSFDLVDSVSQKIYSLSTVPRLDFKRCKSILEKFGRQRDQDYTFQSSFDQMYSVTDRQMRRGWASPEKTEIKNREQVPKPERKEKERHRSRTRTRSRDRKKIEKEKKKKRRDELDEKSKSKKSHHRDEKKKKRRHSSSESSRRRTPKKKYRDRSSEAKKRKNKENSDRTPESIISAKKHKKRKLSNLSDLEEPEMVEKPEMKDANIPSREARRNSAESDEDLMALVRKKIQEKKVNSNNVS